MALTEIERELNNLRRLLRDAREWNWIDYREQIKTPGGRAEAEICLPDLVELDQEISATLRREVR